MRLHILLNALISGDAVSTHCIMLKRRARALGVEAEIYADGSDAAVANEACPVARLSDSAAPEDILLHQFFNESAHLPLVESFPGRRVLMYHNITPPSFFADGSEAHRSCARGLRQARVMDGLYDYACGMSEFSRRELAEWGFSPTGVFPVFSDLDRLSALRPSPMLLGESRPGDVVELLAVGRIVPNKRIEDQLRLLAACRDAGRRAFLVLVGDNSLLPDYTAQMRSVAAGLGLVEERDYRITGKVSDEDLAAYYVRADALVSMSEHEGFGVPLVEAMAFDLPVFSFQAGACNETLGGAGVSFEEKNFPALAEQILGVIGDSERRAAIIAGQRERLRDFSSERQCEALRGLIERVQQLPPREVHRETPSVSVVINTYNRSRCLERCLQSLRAQTYRNFEVVVVNGPSTDDTETMLRPWQRQVRIVRTDKRVLSVSRNEGIAASRGELVAFIDDDAVAAPGWLAELTAAFADQRVGAAGGTVYRMAGGSIEFRNGIIDRMGMVRWDEPAPGLHLEWMDGFLNTVSGNNCIFRRQALLDIGGFDERIEYYHDEADVVMRIAALGLRTVHRPQAVVYHEAANSDNRKSPHRVNWYAVFKNTLFCALKNAPANSGRLRLAARILGFLMHRRVPPMLAWWRNGDIGAATCLTMLGTGMAGMVVGTWRGLMRSTRLRSFERPAPAEIEGFEAQSAVGLSVCLLTQSLPSQSPGGIASYTLSLARGLRELGCRVHVISSEGDPLDEYVDGIWRHRAYPQKLSSAAVVPGAAGATARNLAYANGVRLKINDVAVRWGLDLVESPSWDAEGLLTALEHQFPLVVRLHSLLPKVIETQGWTKSPDLKVCAALEGLLCRQATAVTASTRALLRLGEETYQLPRHNQALIPLGLPVELTAESERRDGGLRILFVGRLERRKGIDVLFDAIAALGPTAEGVSFDIVGRDEPGEHSWEGRWKASSAASAAHVRFHGQVPDAALGRFYEECDIFVAPSLYESFGLIYLEAMGRGKAVVATHAGGIPEVVEDGVTGILVPPGNPVALAAALRTLIRQPETRRQYGRAGRERYLRAFTPEVMARRTLDFYTGVVRAWRGANTSIWQADAIEQRSGANVRKVWDGLANKLVTLVETGAARTALFGPYITLPPGSYRAQFAIRLGAVPDERTVVGIIDVFNIATGFKIEHTVRRADFLAGTGAIFDIYFNITEPVAGSYEFRVHTSGQVPFYVHGIRLQRWPCAVPELKQHAGVGPDKG